MNKAVTLFFRLLDGMVVALTFAILAAVVIAVFSRYVLNSSVSWSEELPALLLANLTFIGAALLCQRNGHLAFDSLALSLPLRPRRWLYALNLTVMAGFAALMCYYSYVVTVNLSGMQLVTLPVSQALFRWVVPLSFALMVLVFAGKLWLTISGRGPAWERHTDD